MVISAMIAATPMMMPSIVRNERILLPRILETDMLTLSQNIPHFRLIIHDHPFRQHAIENVDDSGSMLSDFEIMRDHDNRSSFIVQFLK